MLLWPFVRSRRRTQDLNPGQKGPDDLRIHVSLYSLVFLWIWLPGNSEGVGGNVASESALRSAGTFCRMFEPYHRRLGLTERLKAGDNLVG
ncbi:hypothetical protein PoB_005006200 [Plakobranchus ocellatus]|uniref:Uncharacterized protein n=1 Tax=Plakobranchus ocellatus TaxID=259542 RepID=A0AAV4BWP8_9GAST|nr:hypothetical protein PoB_005006200 [Plakobranchus ocellatus]